jgi:hypothetical protein
MSAPRPPNEILDDCDGGPPGPGPRWRGRWSRTDEAEY